MLIVYCTLQFAHLKCWNSKASVFKLCNSLSFGGKIRAPLNPKPLSSSNKIVAPSEWLPVVPVVGLFELTHFTELTALTDDNIERILATQQLCSISLYDDYFRLRILYCKYIWISCMSCLRLQTSIYVYRLILYIYEKTIHE